MVNKIKLFYSTHIESLLYPMAFAMGGTVVFTLEDTMLGNASLIKTLVRFIAYFFMAIMIKRYM